MRLKLLAGLLALSLMGVACGSVSDEAEQAVRVATDPDISHPVLELSPTEMNDLRCGRWLEDGRTQMGLRQMVLDHPGFDWKYSRDFDQDGYPCEDEIGVGYLPTTTTTTQATPTTQPMITTTRSTMTTTTTITAATTTTMWEGGREGTVCDYEDEHIRGLEPDLIRAFQREIGVVADGSWGPMSSNNRLEYCGITTTTEATTTTIITPEVNCSQAILEDLDFDNEGRNLNFAFPLAVRTCTEREFKSEITALSQLIFYSGETDDKCEWLYNLYMEVPISAKTVEEWVLDAWLDC